MTDGSGKPIENVVPEAVWSSLQNDKNTALVDCRTAQEWSGIGHPDLTTVGKPTHKVEWKQAPAMSLNPQFAEELDAALGGEYPATLYFICRSGVRSHEAATHIQDLLSSRSIDCTCVNVAEGFEGKGGPGASGWRDKNLPWTSG